MNRLRPLERIPLWKKSIPKNPVHFKGDPQMQVFLPLFWMKVINPRDKVPPNYVTFQVHHQMSKIDIKQYLEKLYNVEVLNVRTENREKDVMAMPIHHVHRKSGIKHKVWRETEKFAYVTLKNDKFTYPDHFKKNRSDQGQGVIDLMKEAKRKGDETTKKSSSLGLPPWFGMR